MDMNLRRGLTVGGKHYTLEEYARLMTKKGEWMTDDVFGWLTDVFSPIKIRLRRLHRQRGILEFQDSAYDATYPMQSELADGRQLYFMSGDGMHFRARKHTHVPEIPFDAFMDDLEARFDAPPPRTRGAPTPVVDQVTSLSRRRLVGFE